MALPDEQKSLSGGVRWAAGALDGVRGHGSGGGQSAAKAMAAAEAFANACDRPSEHNLRELYTVVCDDGVLDFIDPMVERLAELRPDMTALQTLGRWLATTASDRGAVKVGIAILGVTGLGRGVGVVRALGAHEEFTLSAAVAMTNGLAEPESELWALASAVDGWGRIHCVECLRNTKDPAIRSWILRQGFRNSIMDEYLAFIAATTGGLLDALLTEDVDRELLTAAGDILQALVGGGPAEDLDDYASGADAVEAFLHHMGTRAETLGDLHTVGEIRSFLSREDGWEARSSKGWTASRRSAFEDRCEEILWREVWRDRITVGLLSDDQVEFWQAERAAQMWGIDTFHVHVERIREDPLGSAWFQAWGQADGERAEQLVALARDLLPLREIATGVADELGLGSDWAPHSALDWTLQALRDHVGVGADLVLVGLDSPVTRNRNMSLQVLRSWPSSAWPDDARAVVEHLARSDPNEDAREAAAKILSDRFD